VNHFEKGTELPTDVVAPGWKKKMEEKNTMGNEKNIENSSKRIEKFNDSTSSGLFAEIIPVQQWIEEKKKV
jgi:hypothetical protein